MIPRPLAIAALCSFVLPANAQEDAASSRLLLCGMGEVFEVEAGSLEKKWSWRGAEREELPEAMRSRFATTDECKPVEGGKKVLISASSGGCALVERPSGRVLWHAQVTNAHSLELLPRDRVVVASSLGKTGNRLVVFDLARSNEPIFDTPLPSAHGVVWDEGRHCLWALGFAELRRYELKDWDGDKASLVQQASHPLPDDDGHDLQAVPRSNDLVISTGRHVYLFDRDKPGFRPHPELGGKEHVKCVSIHPVTGRTAYIPANGKTWWSSEIHFLKPAAQVTANGEKLYKARWLPQTIKQRTMSKISSKQAVALVDTNDAPDLKEWGNKAGTLCVEWFPKIASLLPSEGFAAPKQVTLYFDPAMKGVAHAANGRITISAEFVRAHPDDWGMIVHELTHVVQAYPPGGPGWLVEGLADYIRIVKFEPQAPRPNLTRLASYKDAYKTAAMFLEWVEKQHASGLVVKLNAALRAGKFREELWKEITGKTVDELWGLFVADFFQKSSPQN